ncbi:MAG: hypothetical protein R8G34_00480 [Paracoccaceae bacterium]|nr:hypothetical protein [Paracoccaceae bacterium]
MDQDGNSKYLDEIYALSAMLEFSADRARRIGATSLGLAIDQAQKVAMLEIKGCAAKKASRASKHAERKKNAARFDPV